MFYTTKGRGKNGEPYSTPAPILTLVKTSITITHVSENKIITGPYRFTLHSNTVSYSHPTIFSTKFTLLDPHSLPVWTSKDSLVIKIFYSKSFTEKGLLTNVFVWTSFGFSISDCRFSSSFFNLLETSSIALIQSSLQVILSYKN